MTEVVVMGRLSADIYPTQLRTALRDQRSFTRYVGGFAGNVCTGLARLQVSTAIVSKVGDDGHGEFIRDFLSAEGVDVDWLGVDHTLNTPVVFCEIWPPDRFPLLFYRTPTCPDWELKTGDFDLEAVANAPILLVSGTGLARENSRVAHTAALEQHRHTAILDLDYRPPFWATANAYREAIQAVLPRTDIVVGNEDEVRAATGVDDPRKGIDSLRSLGPGVLIGTAIKNPQPHDIKVGLVGPAPVLEQMSTAFASNAPGAFQFTTYASEDAARAAIDDRSVDGALVLAAGGPRLIVAGAAGDAVTGVITGAFTNVFKAQGQTLTVETVHPFASADPHG